MKYNSVDTQERDGFINRDDKYTMRIILAGKSYEDANSVLEHMFGGSETFSCQDQNLFMHHFKKYLFYTCQPGTSLDRLPGFIFQWWDAENKQLNE